MIIYISGPICNDPNYKEHFAKAEKEIIDGVDSSAVVVNPADVLIEGHPTWYDYMKVDLTLLAGCDTIFMLRGWWHSRGARFEHRIAKALKMKIIYER